MPTNIEWTGESWNPIRARALDNGMIGWHCEHASPGCQNCYAETQNMARRFNLGTDYAYKPGHRKDIEVFLDEAALAKPLGWKKGRKVFVCSMTDLFADFVPDAMIDRIFAVMALCPQHTFQVLTKRSARMREYVGRAGVAGNSGSYPGHAILAAMDGISRAKWPDLQWPLPNVWLGVSVEDQQRADERIPDLLATPAAIRWISAEPLLGPVDLRWIAQPDEERDGVIDALLGCDWIESERGEEFRPARPGHQDRVMRRWVVSSEADILANRKLDWVVVGGESGSKARPMHPDWARSLRNQCATAGVPFFFKQWGEWSSDLNITALAPRAKTTFLPEPSKLFFSAVGKKRAGRLLDGVEHNGMPGGAA